jgi:hypothetical protein
LTACSVLGALVVVAVGIVIPDYIVNH